MKHLNTMIVSDLWTDGLVEVFDTFLEQECLMHNIKVI